MPDVADSPTFSSPAWRKRLMCIVALVAVCTGLAVCAYSPIRTRWKVNRVVARLHAIDGGSCAGESYQATQDRVSDRADEAVNRLSSPAELFEFIRSVDGESKKYGDAHPRARAFPFLSGEERAVSRLVEMATDESAEFLVRAAADPEIHWDGETAEFIAWAITSFGRPCLPHLRHYAFGKREKFLNEMIEAIEHGKVLE